MAKTLQHRRDTTANLASVTGSAGEIFIDTTKKTVVVMDGSTAGGFPLALEGAGGAGATGAQGVQGIQGQVGSGTLITASAVSSGVYYPVCVAASGSSQTPSVRTSAPAFSIDMSTNTLQVTATTAQYADLAECYAADEDYEPGTVVSIGGVHEITQSTVDADRSVLGVVSTNPSYVMNSQIDAEHVVTVALTGRVPCKVQGKIKRGDIVVSAGNGRARSEQDPKVGTVIGKSLENFDGVEGVIEIVVGRL